MTPVPRQRKPRRSNAGRVRTLAAKANRWRQTRWFRLFGFVAGTLLVCLAIAAALNQDPDAMRRSIDDLGRHPWWFVLLFLAFPLLNWLSISASIWFLLSRFGRLGFAETLGLIGMAWLLNYLPMRPGMVGRIAYHKAVNGITIRHTGQTLIEGTVLTGICSGVLLIGAVFLRGVEATLAWILLVAIPMIAAAIASAVLWKSRPVTARYCAAGSLRVLDMAVWAGRYALAFAIVSSPISMPAALVLAVASQVAMLIPLAGNGLGVREWLIGALAAGLPAAMLGGADANLSQGLTADVLNRFVEVLVAVPLGLLCLGIIMRRLRNLQKPATAKT